MRMEQFFTILGNSFTYIEKNKEPSIDPCGTPFATGCSVLITSVVCFTIIIIIHFCSSEAIIEILNVRTSSDKKFVTTYVGIHNRSWFDVNFTMHQDLIGHNLFVNIHLKAKMNNKFRTIQRWKNIDLCRFLSGEKRDPILNYMFENALKDKSALHCPFKKGSFSVKDAFLDASKIPPIVPRTQYRFFLEVSQMMGDSVKMFSLKIDAVYVP
ncbi:uncharacterized protein LOC129942540 [Eupeodes corollae]|uniref:uncharacterized protein LOC129942540 n=1 Tax=Eupeodes corollae TaxID=290404 RepID=UPI002493835E|nr:uncharacterized protein LOC129942540 [Eupeodes corollae]